jgi:methylthioribose-1-phosphate isomerase
LLHKRLRRYFLLETLRWIDGENVIELIDQTLLPGKFKYIKAKSVEAAAVAIEDMQIRGAPAIGCMAAMGVALGAAKFRGGDKGKFLMHMEEVMKRLGATRPTAVNLFWAIERMKGVIERNSGKDTAKIKNLLIEEAKKITAEDVESCERMGRNGAKLLKKNSNVLTHCNAGSLATADFGTALGVIRAGYRSGKVAHVYADETRPRLQGAKLTAFEMVQEGIPCTVICDNTAATLMSSGMIDAVVVGADRIAANGDTANKIGTFPLAIVSRYHGVPFYVAAPLSTIDFSIKTGKQIPIEERDGSEVRMIGCEEICPAGAGVANFAFDVTPNRLIKGIITERGIAVSPFIKSLAALRNK